LTSRPVDHEAVGDPGLAGGESGIDPEHHRHHPPLPVVVGDLVEGWETDLAFEVPAGRFPKLRGKMVVAVGSHLDVDVDIDRCPIFDCWCQDLSRMRPGNDIKVPDILRPLADCGGHP
jgi:hypothetical protein